MIQSTIAPTAPGSDLSIATPDTYRVAYGDGTGSATTPADRAAPAGRRERHVGRLQRELVAGHDRRERRVHARLDLRNAPEAGVQLQQARALRGQLLRTSR
jgi:hypothetical protein